MRPAQSLLSLAVCLSPLATSAAWASWLPDVHALVARADATPSSGAASDNPSSATPTPKADATVASKTNSGNSAAKTDVDLNTANPTKPDKASATKKSDGKPTITEFPPDAPPGGVNMLTPPPNLEPTPLFKIRDFVTLGFNFTSLPGPPSAIDILISCSVASNTWTLTENMTFTTSVEYVWDTNKQADSVENPLLTGLCNLVVKDSNVSINAPAEPGRLNTWSNFIFGLYTPKPYKPYTEFTCVGCSDALSLINRQALGLAVTMSVVTFLSFTWFVAGLGFH